MRFDFEVNLWLAIPVIAVFVIGIVVGIVGTQEILKPNNVYQEPVNCLKTTDLNRDDVAAGIILSRFCEGLGLQSNIYWQTDDQNTPYGIPICTTLGEKP